MAELLTSLRNANLLPSKVIPENFTPSWNIGVKFPANTPENGCLVRKSQAAEQPTVTFSPVNQAASTAHSLTFCLIDPDAPTPDDPKFAYWRHWFVTNIPSSAESVDAGKTLTYYLAPGPKDESGPHRYLFMLFKQPENFALEKSDVGGEEFVDRRNFPADVFAKKHGLELVGVQWMKGVGDGWTEGKQER